MVIAKCQSLQFFIFPIVCKYEEIIWVGKEFSLGVLYCIIVRLKIGSVNIEVIIFVCLHNYNLNVTLNQSPPLILSAIAPERTQNIEH